VVYRATFFVEVRGRKTEGDKENGGKEVGGQKEEGQREERMRRRRERRIILFTAAMIHVVFMLCCIKITRTQQQMHKNS